MGNIQKVFLALLLTISSLMGVSVKSSNVSDYVDSDCHAVAEYICDNLTEFSSQYNSILEEGEESFNAEYCEKQFDVILLGNTGNATCLDFNGENGYMIIADDYVIIAFQISGNLDYIDLSKEIFYDEYCGFEYYDEDLGYTSCLYGSEETSSDETFSSSVSTTPYRIKDPDAYIRAKYGSQYSLNQSGTLDNWVYKKQSDYSFYSYYGGSPEGNCGLLTIYSLLNYYATALNYSKLPTGNTTFTVSNDTLYSSAIQKGWTPKSSSINIPTLYLKVREIAISQYGYSLLGGMKENSYVKLLKSVLSYYGYRSPSIANSVLLKNYSTYVINQINSEKPAIYNIYAGELYAKGHSVVITGYREYKKVTKIWFLKIYNYAKLLEADDGGQDCRNGESVFLDYGDTYRLLKDQMVYIKSIK